MRTVDNGDAQATLERALSGKKPFRRFKDELMRFPEIREQWFAYHKGRMTELAHEWLEENEVLFEETNTAETTD